MADIDDLIQLENWLQNQPNDTIEIVANRLTLRMLPLWAEFQRNSRADPGDSTLMIWRMLFLNWVKFASDHDDTDVTRFRNEAVRSYTSSPPRTAYKSFYNAKNQAEKVVCLSRQVQGLQSQSAKVVGINQFEEPFWSALSFDIGVLDQKRPYEFLANRPLWPLGAPEWHNYQWNSFKALLTGPDLFEDKRHWSVWTRWYEDRVSGNSPDMELELKKAKLPSRAWARPSGDVNQSLKEIEGRHVEKLEAEQDQFSLLALLESTELRAALADFKFVELKQLMTMVPFVDDHGSEQLDEKSQKRREQMISEVKDAVGDLVEDIELEARNVPRSLKNALQRYAVETENDLHDLRPGRLWDLGAILRTASLNDDIEYSLGDLGYQNLTQIVEKHLELMRDYFAATITRQRNVDVLEIRDSVSPESTVAALKDSRDALFAKDWGSVPAPDREIPALISEQIEELEELLSSTHTASSEAVYRRRFEQFWRKAKTVAVTIIRYATRTLSAVGHTLGTVAALQTLFPASFASSVQALVEMFKHIPWLLP